MLHSLEDAHQKFNGFNTQPIKYCKDKKISKGRRHDYMQGRTAKSYTDGSAGKAIKNHKLKENILRNLKMWALY